MKRCTAVLCAGVMLLCACRTVPPAKIAEETTAAATSAQETTASSTKITTIGEVPLKLPAKKIDLGAVSPINKKATAKAGKLLSFLAECYGEKTIAGQYAADSENTELELIHAATGRYPALRLADLGGDMDSTVRASVDWSERGGLVGLMWHWQAPIGGGIYAKDTDFDLRKAVTKEKVALKTAGELEKMEKDKKISPECLALIQDIDEISAELKKLSDAGVTVLWRPLHEASGGWFWWGSAGEDAYKWLWQLLYERQTGYHGLGNLLWVWSAQNPDWYVSCDIISADIYSDEGDYASQKQIFDRLSAAGKGKKIVAMSECSSVPDNDLMAKNGAVWSFFGTWYGEYVMDKFGDLNEEYTTREELIKTYNSAGTVTLDELPSFD